MSGFNFGQPASTGASSGSLFGKPLTPSSGGGSLFGTGTSGASTFGASNTTSTTTPSLFGGASTSTNTGTTGTTTLFGQTPGASTGGFTFGKKPDDNKSNEQSKPPIFGQSTTQPPATPSGSVPSLFGSTTPATTSAPPFAFSNPSTTPAGPPPQSNTFGASTGGATLFGNTQNQAKTDGPKFSFGTPASSAPTPQSDTTKAQNTSNFLGTTPSASLGAFGAKPAEQASKDAQTGINSTNASKPPTFSFAAPASATTTKEGSAPSMFGTASTGTAPTTTTSQSTPSLFGSTLGSNTKTATPVFGNINSTAAPANTTFGQPPKPSSETAPKPTFSFPTAISQPSATTSQATASAATVQKPFFGGPAPSTAATTSSAMPAFKLPSTTTTASTASGATTSTVASTPLFSLGVATNPTPSTTTAATTKPGLFSLGATTGTTTSTNPATSSAPAPSASNVPTLGASNLGASTSGPTPPAQSRLKNKTLDEILTRWATDLTRYTKDFKNQGETIAQWDQIIVDNSSKIDKLYIKTRTCEKQTTSVEMQLAAVENQQNELESWLSKYETDVEEMLAKDSTNQAEVGGPDQERERTYKLAEKLNERLEDMGRDLESMVDQVNAANASLSKHTKADEPITHIVRILNSHLTQLQQIDQGTAALQAKVSSAQKAASHLGYLNGAAGGEGRAAVDDFYRSYMGRR